MDKEQGTRPGGEGLDTFINRALAIGGPTEYDRWGTSNKRRLTAKRYHKSVLQVKKVKSRRKTAKKSRRRNR